MPTICRQVTRLRKASAPARLAPVVLMTAQLPSARPSPVPGGAVHGRFSSAGGASKVGTESLAWMGEGRLDAAVLKDGDDGVSGRALQGIGGHGASAH